MITSSLYLNLEDRIYLLSTKVKNINVLNSLSAYVSSNFKMVNYLIKEKNTIWQTINLKNRLVMERKFDVGFLTDGAANTFRYIDEVSLLKTE